MADLKIEGLADVQTRLSGISDKLVKNVLRSSLRQAANVVREQARTNFDGAAPHPNALTRALQASIRVTARRGTPTRVTYSVVAGDLTQAQQKRLGAAAAFYALWVEKGHINRKAGEALRGGKRSKAEARAASTNNTPAHPYMQPALEAKAQEAIDVLVQSVRDKLPELV
jgi:HK97 gp10 family phage protein